MQNILTIAIPTYNRKEKLEKALLLILEQVKGLPIEVLISDNASSDGTQEFMLELCENHKNIHYHRNDVNIGPDMNFLNCYEMAQGEYVWLVGDDDYILPGTIKNILQVLEKNPVCVFLNNSPLIQEEPLKWGKPRWNLRTDIEYTDANIFLKKIGVFITFLSAFISKTSLVKEIADKKQYCGTYFIQSHIALNVLKNKGKYIINSYNCMAASGNETVSYDLFEVWIHQLHNLLITTGTKCGLNVGDLSTIYRRELQTTVLGFVLYFRQTCIGEKEWKKDYVREYVKTYPYTYILLTAATYCPRFLLKPLYCLYNIGIIFYKKLVH